MFILSDNYFVINDKGVFNLSIVCCKYRPNIWDIRQKYNKSRSIFDSKKLIQMVMTINILKISKADFEIFATCIIFELLIYLRSTIENILKHF